MAHNNYYLDLCVDVAVVNGDAVLLRLHEKYNLWGFPGGHIDAGEDANEAALREVLEETGLTISLVGPSNWQSQPTKTNQDLVPPVFVNRHAINETHQHSAFIFVGVAKKREINTQIPEEETETCWCRLSDLDDLLANDKRMRPEIYRYASTALSLVNNKNLD